MGKYSKKKKKQKKNVGLSILLTALLALLVLLIWVAILLARREVPVLEPGNAGTTQQESTGENTEVLQTQPQMTEPAALELPDGLRIHYIGSYAGMYMEDGTDEAVTDVMMIVLENTSEEDLQLARISIEYEDFTAEFEVTSLPAGERVVALEKNRHPETSGDYLSIQTKNVVFFQKKMNLQEDRIKIEGANGTLEVTNISGEDIVGDIYVYYKNSARDLLYGGITYRVAVRGGLKAGESSMVIAGHYTPNNCRLVLVDCGD